MHGELSDETKEVTAISKEVDSLVWAAHRNLVEALMVATRYPNPDDAKSVLIPITKVCNSLMQLGDYTNAVSWRTHKKDKPTQEQTIEHNRRMIEQMERLLQLGALPESDLDWLKEEITVRKLTIDKIPEHDAEPPT